MFSNQFKKKLKCFWINMAFYRLRIDPRFWWINPAYVLSMELKFPYSDRSKSFVDQSSSFHAYFSIWIDPALITWINLAVFTRIFNSDQSSPDNLDQSDKDFLSQISFLKTSFLIQFFFFTQMFSYK